MLFGGQYVQESVTQVGQRWGFKNVQKSYLLENILREMTPPTTDGQQWEKTETYD